MAPLNTRVLTVDDSAAIRNYIKDSLLELGFKDVETAENGLVALEKLKAAVDENNPYGLVISDINMPEMGGIEFLDHKSKIVGVKEVPVIMLTTESEQKMVITAIARGAKGYVIKPFNSKTLGIAIKNIFEQLNEAKAS